MAPRKRTTRASPATSTTTTTTLGANAQLKTLIDQGVADALATRDADRSMNGDDNHNSGTGVRRQAPLARKLVPLCFAIFTFEPLTLSLMSMPSCDLECLTNILILCLILKALNQSL
ncbi:hypothetical protein Tco_1427479 [Tanacetum coccineum]